jgi:hypothetical protein
MNEIPTNSPVMVMMVDVSTADEMLLVRAGYSGFFLGTAIVVCCFLSAVAILVFGLFTPSSELTLYYQAFFGKFFILSGMLFILGVYLLLSASKVTISISKTRDRITLAIKRLTGTKTLATYTTKDALRVEFRQESKTEKIDSGFYSAGSGIGIILRQRFLQPQQVVVSQTRVIFKDSRELLLSSVKTLSTGQVLGDITGDAGKSVANQVAAFLGIPVEEKKA